MGLHRSGGRPLNPNTDYDEWKRLLRKAGLRDGRLHDARHTAATVLLILGVPARTVMSLMGWSSTEMAARYQHVTDTIRLEVARQVDALIWQARGGEGVDDDSVAIDRASLATIMRLAELGLTHADSAEVTGGLDAVEQIRSVLTEGAGNPPSAAASLGETPPAPPREAK